MIRRRNEAGGYNYFISLLNDKAIDGTVTLATDAKAVEIFDPMTGKNGLAASSQNPAGGTRCALAADARTVAVAQDLPHPGQHGKMALLQSRRCPHGHQ